MGEVYLARHQKLGREAAIKLLPPYLMSDAEYHKRFEREAASAAALQHPNILAVWDYSEQDDIPYLVMPFIRGGSLKELLARKSCRLETSVKYLRQIATALDHAHARGVVHRDIKPANLLLDEQGWLYLADFGIAKMMEGAERFTRTGVSIGTPEYMAPEQARGRADTRSDIYALGIVLYQLLTGRVPFTGESSVEILMKHLQDPLPLEPLHSVVPGLPAGIDTVLQRALAKRPEERFQSAGEVVDAVLSVITAEEEASPQWHIKRQQPPLDPDAETMAIIVPANPLPDQPVTLPPTVVAPGVENAKAWVAKGNELGMLGRWAEALAAYEEALRLQPDYARAWRNKGAALSHLGRPEEALAAHEEALRLQPDDALTWREKGAALTHLGRPEEALAAVEEALRLQQLAKQEG